MDLPRGRVQAFGCREAEATCEAFAGCPQLPQSGATWCVGGDNKEQEWGKWLEPFGTYRIKMG